MTKKSGETVELPAKLCVACRRVECAGVPMEVRVVSGEPMRLCVNPVSCRSSWPRVD